ncbi:SdpI family protein [Bacteroidota bacterium]
MDWTNLAFIIPFVTAPVYIIAGLIMIKFPPKTINNAYGYRTPRSVRSQQRWDFAQKYSSRQMIIWGFVMLIASLLSSYIHTKSGFDFLIGLAILVIFTAIPIALTEKQLKKNFKF